MLTTCFVAALFHGIVILGVTFNSPNGAPNATPAPALEVVLVNDTAPVARDNPNARYVAQRTQLGSGTPSGESTRIPRSSPLALDRQGDPTAAGIAARSAVAEPGNETLVTTRAPTLKVLYFSTPDSNDAPADAGALLEDKPDLGMTPNDDGIELRLRGEARRQLWIAADTRASDVAVYLDAWRRKIERIGTMNFPTIARQRSLSGTPVIEVTIGANGKLLGTVVRRSSGHAEIDEAAMRILKLAAPYDPFPATLTAKHDEIRIAYEWQFVSGAAPGSTVYAAPNP